jgi:hypothetical protein
MVEHLLVPHTSWLFGVSTILGKGQYFRSPESHGNELTMFGIGTMAKTGTNALRELRARWHNEFECSATRISVDARFMPIGVDRALKK